MEILETPQQFSDNDSNILFSEYARLHLHEFPNQGMSGVVAERSRHILDRSKSRLSST